MLLDVFKADAFSLSSLTKAINLIPYQPMRLGRLGLFSQEPITTTSVQVELQNETLALVAAKPRGAPATPVVPNRRAIKTLNSTHLPTVVSVYADEVQNLRAFGTESEEATAQAWLARKQAVARRRLELTQEYHRVGALKGLVLDSDGSTVLTDLYAEFGVTQQRLPMVLGTASTKVLQLVMTIKRMVEDELGGAAYTNIRVECSPEFFDAFTGHAAVVSAFAYYNQTQNRSDVRTGFTFGDVTFEEYRGSVGGTRFIEAGMAYAFPEGVPDMFVQHYAPAPYMETVNTMGLPFYSQVEMMDMNKGVLCEMQSNPLTFNTRPRAVVKLDMAAS